VGGVAYRPNDEWRLLVEPGLLVATAGADRILALETADRAAADELVAAWETDRIEADELSAEARELLDRLGAAGITSPRLAGAAPYGSRRVNTRRLGERCFYESQVAIGAFSRSR